MNKFGRVAACLSNPCWCAYGVQCSVLYIV